MLEPPRNFGVAVVLFASNNIDAVFILLAFFADPRLKLARSSSVRPSRWSQLRARFLRMLAKNYISMPSHKEDQHSHPLGAGSIVPIETRDEQRTSLPSGVIPDSGGSLAYRIEERGAVWAWELFVPGGSIVASGTASSRTEAMATAFRAALKFTGPSGPSSSA